MDTRQTSTTDDFLAWVKGEVIKGYPVAIGVYENEDLFYGTTKPDAGDPNTTTSSSSPGSHRTIR